MDSDPYVIELERVLGAPNDHNDDPPDCFVTMEFQAVASDDGEVEDDGEIEDRTRRPTKRVVKWPCVPNAKNPSWMLSQEIPKSTSVHCKDDELIVKLYDRNTIRAHDHLGTAIVKRAAAVVEGEQMVLPFDLTAKAKEMQEKCGETGVVCAVVLKRVDVSKCPKRKVVFLIRHGESEWNRAGDEGVLSVIHQLQSVDHGLSKTGVEQALDLRRRLLDARRRVQEKRLSENDATRKDDGHEMGAPVLEEALIHRMFNCCTSILFSPLARAVQTGLLALQDHPRLWSHGATLCPWAREIKMSATWRDCIGAGTGPAIKKRATQMLRGKISEPGVERLKHIPLHDQSVRSQWWVVGSDEHKGRDRTDYLMNRIRYCEDRVMIVVAHSALFRETFKHYVSEAAMNGPTNRRRDLLKSLQTRKLKNGALLATVMHFKRGKPRQVIDDAFLLADSGLCPEK